MAFNVKYSNGGITEERAMRMERWYSRQWSDAFSRLNKAEIEASKPDGPRDVTVDDDD